MGKGRSRIRSDDVDRVVRALRSGATTLADVLSALDRSNDRDADRAYRKALKRHEHELARWQARVVTGGTAAAVTLGAAVVTTPWWLVGTSAAAAWAVSGWRRLRTTQPPARPPEPVPPLPRLPRGSAGAAAVDQLGRAERHLTEVVPAVERLHPGAGQELRAAASAARPPLHALAERLAVLQRVRQEMAGTEAGAAAEASLHEVQLRLERGVEAYEGLLAAAATLLGAPDLDRGVEEVVQPAVEGLRAYTYGLAAAQPDRADRLEPPGLGD